MEIVNPLTAYPIGEKYEDILGIPMRGVPEKQGTSFSRHGWLAAKDDPTLNADAVGKALRRQLRPLSKPILDRAKEMYSRHEVPEFPPYMILEPVGGICQRSCPFCTINVIQRHTIENKPAKAGMMKWTAFKRLMEECGQYPDFTYGASLYELGETGLWKGRDESGERLDWADLVDCAKKVGKFRAVNISTNADLEPSVFNRLLECDLDDVIISIDGNDADTYNTNRPSTIPNDTGTFERTIDRTMAFLDRKATLGYPKPFVRIQIINNASCAPQILDFINRWIRVPGVDDCYVKNLDSMNSWIKGLVTDEEDEIKAEQVSDMPCQHLWMVGSMVWTGHFNSCSHDAKTELTDGSNIFHNSFHDWWHGPFLSELRAEHLRGAERMPCKDCRERDCWLG